MKTITNIADGRFAACATGPRLLSIVVRTARRAPVSESGFQFHLSAGCNDRDRFKSVSQNDINYLKRCEIFRGKVPPRITQQQYHLETRTHLRQIYE
jgi:hypothetical protein